METIVGSQMYHWSQHYGALGTSWDRHLDEIFTILNEAGIAAWEQTIASQADLDIVAPYAAKYNIALPSVYTSGKLHEDDWEDQAARVIQGTEFAKAADASVVVMNPDPIAWHTGDNKTDAQLRNQAQALNLITKELRARGMSLAYHTHTSEMRAGAREFHHMMLATAESGMGFCLDAHWIYRGAENSALALHDVLTLYGDRVVSLHLRQSVGGVWTEYLQDGDLDYTAIVARLNSFGFSGPIQIEAAQEKGTPSLLTIGERYGRSRDWVRATFGV